MYSICSKDIKGKYGHSTNRHAEWIRKHPFEEKVCESVWENTNLLQSLEVADNMLAEKPFLMKLDEQTLDIGPDCRATSETTIPATTVRRITAFH